jgi:hypothetical protein
MLQKKATSYLNAVLDQDGPAQTSWCFKWAVHGKASRPASSSSSSNYQSIVSPVGARRLQDSRGCWQQWVSPGGSDQLRQQRARPDIAPVDPGREPSLTVTYGSPGDNGRITSCQSRNAFLKNMGRQQHRQRAILCSSFNQRLCARLQWLAPSQDGLHGD